MSRILASFTRDWRAVGLAGTALLLLLAGVVTNRYRFESLSFRPHTEHFAILIALAALAYLFIRKRAHFTFQASDLLLGAYLAVALASSVLFPPDPRESLQYWARMVLSIAVFFIVRWLMSADSLPSFRLIIKALLIFGVLQALFGIASWILYPLGINLGVDEYPLGVRGPGGILCNFSLTMYGTLWEPNIFGSTLMLVILLGAALFVSNEYASWRTHLGIALAIMLVAMALNSSRGAFLTLALGLVLIVLFARGMSFGRRTGWAVGATVLVLLINIPSQQLSGALMQLPTAPGLATRAPCAEWIAAGMPRGVQPGDPTVDPSTGPATDVDAINRMLEGQTLASRWVSYQNAWDDFLTHPLLGNGANSFGQKYTTTAHTPGWISNLVLMSLHDTGIIGTIILLVWLVWFAWKLFRAWRGGAADASLRTMVFALGVGVLCLFIAYQVTTMLWFGLAWFLLATLETGSRTLAEKQSG